MKHEKLWTDLKTNLINFTTNLNRIIRTKAWEPLGYDTFTEAWADLIGDLPLTAIQEGALIHALMEMGATTEEIIATVPNVGPVKTAAYQQAYEAGLSPSDTAEHVKSMTRSVKVSEYKRVIGRPPKKVTIRGYSESDCEKWIQAAEKENQTLEEWLTDTLIWAANHRINQKRVP